MTDKAIHQYLLSTDGVNQLERSLLALDPSLVRIDPRSSRDILRFLYALSAQVRYYDLNDQPLGDWRPFLDMLVSGGDVIESRLLDQLLLERKDWPPHLALLMSFLHVYSYAQQDLNLLPTKRLNFYYQDVLKLQRRPAIPDQVHVVVELSRNAPATLLPAGTLLKAGATASGAPLQYGLDSDYVIGHAQIGSIKSSLAETESDGERTLYKSEDATQLRASIEGWRPFGVPSSRSSEALKPMDVFAPGFAVASPSLLLAEGDRVITVILNLTSRTQVASTGISIAHAIEVSMTGESEWLVPTSIQKAELRPVAPEGGDEEDDDETQEFRAVLTITVEFDEAAPPITAYVEEVHQAALATAWPAWRLTVKPASHLMDTLSSFTVDEVSLKVEARGLRNLVVQNDQAVQSADAPILPFGSTPRIGSSFYIGSGEAFSKSITSLAVHFEWQDPPQDFGEYYAGYDNPLINYDVFRGDLYLLAGRRWALLTPTEATLFNSTTQTVKTIEVAGEIVAEQTAYYNYRRRPDLPPFTAFTTGAQQGFLRLELVRPRSSDIGNDPAYAPVEAFGHKAFPTIYARKALDIAQGVPDVLLPQPPYTPTLSSVSLDYSAQDTFRPGDPNGVDQFFLLDVFGSAESDELAEVSLLPRHPHEAALYLGLENASPPRLLSLLFQFEEGSVPGVELLETEEIAWHYLAGGQWRPIARTDILEDKTAGFQVPGLVRLLLGADATSDHTLMPPGMHWLRASVMSKSDGAAGVLDVFTQAVRGSLQIPAGLEEDYDEHLETPLPAESITSLANKVAAVKKVRQPYPSFGGRPSESDRGYHQRVHERLRHRNRAVSAWDYERLILEAFPTLFKVKCLPHTDADNNLAPGHVKLVVVPDWRKRSTGDPLRPKANGAFLRSIDEFLEGRLTSEHTEVHVTNPAYESLLVDSKVRFNPGFDPGFHAALLVEEIKRFLSPWAYEEGEDIVFGGKVLASEILAFIEGREYVDHVIDFELYHQHDGVAGGGISEMQIGVDFIIAATPEPTIGLSGIGKRIGDDFVVGIPVETAAATRPDAILVSKNTHRIGVLSAEGEECIGVQAIGIGQMLIGLDFVIVT